MRRAHDKSFASFAPFIAQLAKTADPDATLNQLVRFVEAYGLRSLLFELLAVNPRLLELIIKTFDASRYAGDLLIRRPQLLEETTRSPKLDQPGSCRPLATSPMPFLRPNQPVRTYRQTQWLRILVRDILSCRRASLLR